MLTGPGSVPVADDEVAPITLVASAPCVGFILVVFGLDLAPSAVSEPNHSPGSSLVPGVPDPSMIRESPWI